ncbi:MAG TPA: penicillin-binding protein [Clostridiales bacterium]|nr:penicillin-binding protein [Clostridiales bacterium]
MKRTLTRSILGLIMAIAFVGGLGLFTFRISTNANAWVQQNYNGHMSGSSGLEQAGIIYDRNGNILAHTVDGKRVYSDDYETRLATLHVVGDNSLNISTAVQSIYRDDLTGFNYVWGLGLPSSLKSSKDITLTIDSQACKTAYEALGDYNGAVVVYNYKTGEVLCSVSKASYDPQDPPEITEENEEEYAGVYVDRVISGLYPPGSTFKIITSAAAIENMPDIYNRTFTCNGSVNIGGQEISCMSTHGDIGFEDALAHSCNVVFAEIADELGNDIMQKTAEEMGFTKSYSVGDIPTARGEYDLLGASQNERAWSGIGQFTDLANPMQMAIMCGAIANGGDANIPFEVKTISSFFGLAGLNNTAKTESLIKSSTANQLNDLMRNNVTSYYGDDMFETLSVCAKTGTAEVGDGKEPHAWMVGYSQDTDAPLAFAVIVENSGYGYSVAGPVAVSAMEACANVLRN